MLVLLSCQREDPEVPYDISAIYADNLDNSQQELIAAPDSVYKLAYVMRLTYAAQITPGHENEYDKYESPMVKNDMITGFSITCPVDFDAAHPAGTPLNDLFDTGMTLSSGAAYNKISNRMHYPARPVDLWLMSPPAQDGSYLFNIELQFQSGKVLSAQTLPVYFHS